MMPNAIRGALCAAALSCLADPSLAHVTFEVGQAPADSTYKAVLRVPHGCAGQATRAVRVLIPDGVLEVKPMPKPGWTLSTTRAAYPKAYDLGGKPVTEGVREIVWSGGELPDEQYDEFVFRARLSGDLAGRAVPFPVVQDCEAASERWTEVAAPGQDAHALRRPAPVLRVASGIAARPAPALFKVGALTIEGPWTRATPGGAKVAGGYMRITNAGVRADRLVGGSLAGAGRFELHETQVGPDGVMRMRPLGAGLAIGPGESVELRPGGHHAMFLDLARPLTEGEALGGTLRFETAGSVEVTYAVRGVGAQGAGPPPDEHKH